MVWRGFLLDGAIWFHVLPLLQAADWKKSIRNFNHVLVIPTLITIVSKFSFSPPKLRCLLSTAGQYHKSHTNSISPNGTKISQPSSPFNECIAPVHIGRTLFSNLFAFECKIRFVNSILVHCQLRIVGEIISIFPFHCRWSCDWIPLCKSYTLMTAIEALLFNEVSTCGKGECSYSASP